jgi:hypothetical protein
MDCDRRQRAARTLDETWRAAGNLVSRAGGVSAALALDGCGFVYLAV